MEQLTNNTIGPAEAARLIEERINDQIHANLSRDAQLRTEWERRTGKAFDRTKPLRDQVEEPSPQRHGDTEKRSSADWPAINEHQDQGPRTPKPTQRLSPLCLGASVVHPAARRTA
jgi:hypothetical protein